MSSRRRIVRNVLSIDGSGFRGLTQLQVLEELMKRHSGNTSNPSRPCDVFDLICGSGAGGLIAILVGRLEMTCEQAIRAYNYLESTIFNPSTPALQGPPQSSPPHIPDPPRHVPPPTIPSILAGSPFNTDRFRSSLDWIITNFAPNPMDLNMRPNNERTLRCRTLVTVVPTSAAYDVDAVRIRSYASPRRLDGTKDPDDPSGHRWQIRDAAMGTTSCPSTFNPFPLPSQQGQPLEFMAANTAGFSNPSMIAYLETKDIDQHLGFTLISLGMGLRRLRPVQNTNQDPNDQDDVPDDVDQMVGQLGGDQRLKGLINQTLRVATSAQMKHLRLNTLITRSPRHEYRRFDPPRLTDQHPLVFVDYAQGGIQAIIHSFFSDRNASRDMTLAMDVVQGVPSRWIRLPGYASSSDPDPAFQLVPRNPPATDRPSNINEMTALQIMGECYRWEANRGPSARRVSCFSVDPMDSANTGANKTVRVITGDFVAQQERNSELIVRVHLNDQWLFIGQRVPSWLGLATDWDGVLSNAGLLRSPVTAIQEAESSQSPASDDIMAFASDGYYTTSDDLTPEQVNVHESTFTHPFHGTWIRAYMP